ncbi:sodium:solute symporter family protein [Sciscionella sediminilitoris]|uniref:sodium:solute symporter family protein n=1 Tax=Sciscionella sediminilitoris TaxID=1445613 RepID=UPI000689688F|nr:sodium:solute symporter family protein [Sciscionella sp. SE31]
MVEKYTLTALFALVLIYLAYRSWRRARTHDEFDLAGRRTGLLPLVGTLGAAEFNTATLIGGASVAYQYGTVGLYYTAFIFVFVFGIYAGTVAKPYRRLRISTIAEYFERRFTGRLAEPTRLLASLITLSFTWLAPATYLAGISVVASVLLGVDPITTVVVVVVFCLVLAITGGLVTAISFDVLSYAMILIFVPVLFAVGLVKAGGLSHLGDVFQARFLSFEPVWDLDRYGFASVLAWCFQNILAYIAAPWYGQRMFSARSERIAYRGMVINTVAITVLYGLVAVTTMLSRVLMPHLARPEEALPRMVLNYTPAILQGLILVTLLLVGKSTMMAMWNAAVSIATNDVIRRYLAKDRPSIFYVRIGRLLFVAIGATTLVLSLTMVGSILLALTYISVYLALLAFPILAGLFWKRFSTAAAFGSLLAGAVYVTIALLAELPYYLISPVGVALSAVVGVTVSLARRVRETPEAVDEFFALAHASGQRGPGSTVKESSHQ